MKKALFWDFDGTLVHKNGSIWSSSMYAALNELGYDIDIEEIRQHFRKGYSWHTPEIAYTEDTGQKWWKKLFNHLASLCEIYGLSKGETKEINRNFTRKVLDFRNYTLYEDATTVLRKCMEMGYHNYIVSNNYPELALIVKDLGLSQYFTDYAVSANIGYEKPRIEIFEYALHIAGFPDICYMIGDNPVADIQGGKSAGMKTILVHNDTALVADCVCENLSEIPLIIEA